MLGPQVTSGGEVTSGVLAQNPGQVWAPISRADEPYPDHEFTSSCCRHLCLAGIRLHDRVQKLRAILAAQDFDIGHHAMAANESRRDVMGQEVDFLNEGIDLVVGCAVRESDALRFLSPSNQDAKPCRLEKLGHFAGG